MDDLISREAAIEYLMTNMGWTDEDGYSVDDADEKRAHIEDLINGVPCAPAVPLEPLCNFLASYAAPPIRSPLAIYGSLEEAWKAFLIDWMGEQNALHTILY